jgi:hypothetical protein
LKNEEKVKVGIGFATGRKNFQQVLKTNVQSWKESGLLGDEKYSFNLFIAYDLTYKDGTISDFKNINPSLLEHIDGCKFIGKTSTRADIDQLVKDGIISRREAEMLFVKGYAGQRNIVLFEAIKNKMDNLIFLDDDEYPMAVSRGDKNAVWTGQEILATHLKHIGEADITHGNHCGYISPIPYLEFDDTLPEEDFRKFVEALSNELVKWDRLKVIMKNGGVTYADEDVLKRDHSLEVEDTNHAKFISGANLCINLKDIKRVFPFYNPPGARGEDTFLSTWLSDRKVLKVPCYAFHDGFSAYNCLLDGVLPRQLKFIRADSEAITNRFYRACIGWIRYKPLLLYITGRDTYREKIREMKKNLEEVLPGVCAYFNEPNFKNVLIELDEYDKNVENHYQAYLETQEVWAKIMEHYAKDGQ